MRIQPTTTLLALAFPLTILAQDQFSPALFSRWESLDAKYNQTSGFSEFEEGFRELVTPRRLFQGKPVIDDAFAASVSKNIEQYFATQTALESVPDV